MPEAMVNGIRLHYEEDGDGAPILCIHGTGSQAAVWENAVPALAERGRVITYDRRGCGASERPDPYEHASVVEQAADAAALLEALGTSPTTVIGRSYGGAVAVALALNRPDRVRALVLLEPGDIHGVSPPMDKWTAALYGTVKRAAAVDGPEAAALTMINGALGEGAWDGLPAELREIFAWNAPAILAEADGEQLRLWPAALSRIPHPTLIVAAEDSPPEFRDLCEALADLIPKARLTVISGGHLIDPSDPVILEFLDGLPGASRL